MDYIDISLTKAYSLLNTGGIVLVCTRNAETGYNLAPVAWTCPLDYEPISKVLIVMDPDHLTFSNIETRRDFSLALPTYEQRHLVESTGSVSGRDVDKYAKFGISATRTNEVDTLIPEAVAGWIECRLIEIHRIGSVGIIAGEVAKAAATQDAWKLRLHMAGDNSFYRPGMTVE